MKRDADELRGAKAAMESVAQTRRASAAEMRRMRADGEKVRQMADQEDKKSRRVVHDAVNASRLSPRPLQSQSYEGTLPYRELSSRGAGDSYSGRASARTALPG